MKDIPLAQRRFLADIELVRIFCITLIMSYHIWFHQVSGGIDVFFVFTGFFTMLSMLHAIEQHGRLSLSASFLRSLHQLWLYGLAVAVCILAALFIYYPPSLWEKNIEHFIRAVFFVENWHLLNEATDYEAFHEAASPFQHYWSLAIQWQYTMVTTIVMILVATTCRRLQLPPRRITVVLVVSFIAASFTYAYNAALVNEQTTYFDTFARVWELAAGALIALVLPYLRLPKLLAYVSTVLGIACVIATGIVMPPTAAFASIASILPVFGAMLVLIGANSHSMKPLKKSIVRAMSRYVYGLFLWHWPILMVVRLEVGERALTLYEGLFVMSLSLILAIVSEPLLQRCVLMPLKRASTKRVLQFMLGCGSAALIAYVLSMQYVAYVKAEQAEQEQPASDYPGAAVLYRDAQATANVPLIPPSIHVRYDVPPEFADGACKASSAAVEVCSFGVLENPTYTIALIGGSHSQHWFPALEPLAEELNFKLDAYIFDGCRFTANDFDGQMTEECLQWNDNVLEALTLNAPDAIFTTATLNKHPSIPTGYSEQWRKVEGLTQIIAVTDNPRMPHDVPSCIERNEDALERCNIPRSEALPEQQPWDVTPNLPHNVTFINMNDSFCDDTTCYATLGNIIMYRDDNHLTAAYMKTVAPALREPLQRALQQLNE